MNEPEVIERLLRDTRTWAVVGLSPDPSRDSHRIAALLQREGKRIVPVNPLAGEVLGERAVACLSDVREPIDVVDVFRRSETAGEVVDQAVEAGARAVWLQLGVIDDDAATRAQDAGLDVVMDRCPAIELRRLGPRAA